MEGYPKKNVFTFNENNDGRFSLGPSNDPNIQAYPAFVKSGDNLYKLLGYVDNQPVYTRSTTLGFTDKQSYLNLREYKYGSVIDSNFTFNNGGQDMADAYTASEEIREREGFVDANDIRYTNNTLTEMLEKNLEEILFSEKDSLSLQDSDFTKDDC